ncbi:MAG: TSUP family transporter [Acidobacteriota bacterium]
METAWLCLFALIAGFVDSVVGGGGLIQLPALLLFLPAGASQDLADVLGTNKAASIWGTGMAVLQYAPRVRINWSTILPAAATAFVFAFLGSLAVAHLDRTFLEPLILVLLVAVTLYTFFKPDLGDLHAPALTPRRARGLGLVVGVALGFYDGFFGPGMGSFLIFIFVGVFGLDFLRASASAKVVNFATNLAALLLFASTGHVLYRVALPMAACQIAGSIAGVRLAMLKGNRFVRVVFLVVAMALIMKFGWDVAAGK